MSIPLPNAKIVLQTGGTPLDGWQFWVGTGTPQTDPEFTADENGDPFVSGTIYGFYGTHPIYSPDIQLVRVVFNDYGGYETLSPEETGPTPPASPTIPTQFTTINPGDVVSFVVENGIAKQTNASLPDLIDALPDDDRERIGDAVNKTLDTLTKENARIQALGPGAEYEIDAFAGYVRESGSGSFVPARLSLGRMTEYLSDRITLAALTQLAAKLVSFFGLDAVLAVKNVASFNILLTANSNFILLNRPADPAVPRGLFVLRESDAAPTRTELALRHNPDGTAELVLNDRVLMVFRDDRILLQTPILQGDTTLYAREIGVSTAPLVRDPSTVDLVPVAVYNELTRIWEYKYLTPDAYAGLLLNTDAFKQALAGAGTTERVVSAGQIYCEDVPVAPPAEARLSLSGATDGQTVTHPLETAAIEYDAYSLTPSGAYVRDGSVGLSDITTATFKLVLTGGAFTGYLRVRNATL